MKREDLDAVLNSTNPFNRLNWSGSLTTMDGTSTDDFTADDVAEVIASGQTDPDEWDGQVAAVLLLNDGRYVTYETFWDATGDGFCEDAYGGRADIVFASSLDTAVRFGLTRRGRQLVGMPLPEEAHTDSPGGAP